MGMTCKELFKGIDATFIGNASETIEGLEYYAGAVSFGEVFFCIVGTQTDGHSFAQDAIDRGAKAIVAERKVYLADATDVVEIIVSDSRKAMARAAGNFYGNPSQAFDLVGVTGTRGKTETASLVEHIAGRAGKRTGVLNEGYVRIAGAQEQLDRAAVESPDLQYLLARMRQAKVNTVAMEVSSLSLALDRVYGTRFAVTAFSNLMQDHLDYHKTFEAYFEAKAKLFGESYPARRVICIDDTWGRELLTRCAQAGDHVISTGFAPDAQIHPVSFVSDKACTHIELSVRGSLYTFDYPHLGKDSVSDMMLAFGICLELNIPAETIIAGLSFDAVDIAGKEHED